jgi:molecular chaperone DnaK
MDKKVVIGIDLGTTTSEACIYVDDKYKHMKSPHGNIIIPSIVTFNEKTQDISAGEIAFNRAKSGDATSVEEIKRLMGTEKKIAFGSTEYSPSEISSEILKYIKTYTEEFLQEKVEHAVITVPASFNNNQKQDTKRAAELAGFKVERLVAEPTAAALAYCMENTKGDDFVKLMVYDLGGGTFDVTVGEFHKGVLDIKGVSGDPCLGGKDFDHALADLFIKKIVQEHGVDLKNDPIAMNTIKRECETLKKELSFQESSSVNIPFLAAKDGKPIGLSETITRDQFEELIQSDIDRTAKAMAIALKEAEYKPTDIDMVLLVGGSSRIPLVRETVKSIMKKEPKTDIDPDLAVSLGAAMQSAIITGDSDGVIMDIAGLSFGTSALMEFNGQMLNGVYSEILKSTTPQLKPESKQYYTVQDDQELIQFEVFQKPSLLDSMWAKDMDYLDSKEISGIPRNTAGEESITATFVYNLNGIIEVNITIDSTSEAHTFEIDPMNGKDGNSENIQDSGSDAEILDWENHELAQQYGSTIRLVNKALEKQDNDEIRGKLHELMKAICDDNSSAAESLDDELNDILFELED